MKSFLNASEYLELSIFECGKEECVKDKAICLTKKNYHLFHYVLFGKGTLVINRREYHLGKNTIFFIPANTDAIYFPDKDDPWVYEWVGFSGSKIEHILEELNITDKNPIIEDKNKNYRHYFDEIVKRYVNNGYLDLSSLGALYQLFGEMIYERNGPQEGNKTAVNIQLAKDFINNNYQFDISILDIARNAHVSPNYLSAIFQKEEGMTTKRYLTMVRMTKALTLLQSGQFNIKTVSEMVGFKNQLHFSNEFKKYYGSSPINYLKEGLTDEK